MGRRQSGWAAVMVTTIHHSRQICVSGPDLVFDCLLHTCGQGPPSRSNSYTPKATHLCSFLQSAHYPKQKPRRLPSLPRPLGRALLSLCLLIASSKGRLSLPIQAPNLTSIAEVVSRVVALPSVFSTPNSFPPCSPS